MSIKGLILDVDGTLTDGKLYISNNGDETKAFNVKDGLGIVAAMSLGIEVILLTGKSSKIVERRAQELGIKHIYQGVKDKVGKIKDICNECDIELENLAYMGDDLNDYGVMKLVKLRGCPKDAAREIVEISHFVSSKCGGDGAAREFIEYILQGSGRWREVVNHFTGEQ